MNEFIEKLIGRLEEATKYVDLSNPINPIRCEVKSVHPQKVIEIVNQLAEEYKNDFCEWTQDDKEIDVYYTKCGQTHIFIDGSPEENAHVFCPYCGKKIKVVE